MAKGNILIVDDTPDNLRLLANMLTQQGYKVRSAISGSIALMAVRTVTPDLILLDISMPQMDGYAVCQALKADETTREIPVIFLSAYSEAIDKVKAFQVGGVDYITKPFQIAEVLARVDNQLTLRQVQAELQQAKMDALRSLEQEKELNRLKSEFVSMISHEFRTPLTTIQGFAELLQFNSQLTLETQDRYFTKINGAIQHLLNLLDEILLIGGMEIGKIQYKPAPLNLKQFCHDLIEGIQLSADQSEVFYFNCTEDFAVAEMDETLLRKILTNLLSNAIKYSPDKEPIYFDVHRQDDMGIFQIKDHGIGIPLEHQSHVFETFYRSSNVGQIKGTGLGLAVVKRCVEAHQGSIHLESQPGSGTTVTVKLPLYPNKL